MESPERNKISFGAITNRQAESILDILLARLITFNLFFFADFPKAIKNITLFPGARGEKKSAAMSVPGFDTSIGVLMMERVFLAATNQREAGTFVYRDGIPNS